MMTAMTDTSPQPAPDGRDEAERKRRLRQRNLIVLALLIAWVALIYLVAIVRMGAQ